MYELGARYMTLTHTRNNDWADSATDAPAHHGLTTFGKDVVREMNRLGMLVDLSHVSPETMKAALAISEAPVIFSHSSARAIVDHPRNVPDDILRLVAQNGGVVMVNFYPGYISDAANHWDADHAAEQARFNSPPYEGLYIGQPERAKAAMAAWEKDHPRPSVDAAAGRRSHRTYPQGGRGRSRGHRIRLRRHRGYTQGPGGSGPVSGFAGRADASRVDRRRRGKGRRRRTCCACWLRPSRLRPGFASRERRPRRF